MIMTGDIADNWKELSGKNNWKGLLRPLHINLRRYIIHYGERVQAIYDALNNVNVKDSKMYGYPRCPPEDLFCEVGLEKGNPYKYTVTNYFYARSDTDFLGLFLSDKSAWFGYVAVATDEGKAVLGRRDILISWRGTQSCEEWFKNFEFTQTSASAILGKHTTRFNPMVHYGFYSLYTTSDSKSKYNKSSAREQVLSAVRRLVDKYKDEEISITVTGHSLGSALATLNVADIVANGYNKPTGSNTACMVTAFMFASPRVGNFSFKAACNGLSNLHLLRIRNARDVVPGLPPFDLPILLDYEDVGEELKIDTTMSPYVRTDIISVEILIKIWHDLENYLHGVAGTQRNATRFELVVDRSIALLNKGLNILKKEYGVPGEWWVVKNKNMIQLESGSWKLNEYVPDPPSI